MKTQEAYDRIETHTPNIGWVQLVRRYHFVATQPRGARTKNRSTHIRYELETGEPVELLRDRVWLHPLTGEELLFVGFGRIQ